jgi:cyclic-di-GMP-binding protein
MTPDLPPTDTEQPPLFTTPDQCSDWQKTLPLPNPIQAQAQLLRQLHLLNRFTLPGTDRLAILEILRDPIHFVQDESARKFSGKPLPLAPPEQAALETTHSLWQALANGYLRCLATCLDGDAGLKPQVAMICQRALATLASVQIHRMHAGTQPDDAHWQLAHRIYAGAEALGATITPSADGLRATQPITPEAAYAELMLLQTANLHELVPHQQRWVMRWARRWAGKVAIGATPPPESPALPLCVDLDGSAPAAFKPQTGPGVRWLDTTELRKSLKKRLTLLARGAPEDTPARLGLGEDCTQPACGELLRRIYPRWVKGGVLRRHERHPLSGPSRLVVGVDAVHYYVSGSQPFKAPGATSSDELRRQREELATFGRIAARFEDEYSRNHGYQLENWQVIEDWGTLDHSSGGLRLERPLKQEGNRLGIGQLVAVQPAGTSALLLGVVRWAQVDAGKLVAGIQLFPGKPLAVALRGTGVTATREPYRPGFLLPSVAALELPASAVLPPGSYKPNRILDAWTPAGSQRIRIQALLDRGADFERAVYEAMPPD